MLTETEKTKKIKKKKKSIKEKVRLMLLSCRWKKKKTGGGNAHEDKEVALIMMIGKTSGPCLCLTDAAARGKTMPSTQSGVSTFHFPLTRCASNSKNSKTHNTQTVSHLHVQPGFAFFIFKWSLMLLLFKKKTDSTQSNVAKDWRLKQHLLFIIQTPFHRHLFD